MKALVVALALVASAVPALAADLPVDACTRTVVLRGDCAGFVCASTDLAPWAGACVAPLDCRKLQLCQPCTCPPLRAGTNVLP